MRPSRPPKIGENVSIDIPACVYYDLQHANRHRFPGFDKWIRALRDHVGKATIAKRIDRLAQGHAGDAKSVGDGVTELRVDVGPGYRVYFVERDGFVIVLLCGGDKGTQARDIAKAKRMASEFQE